MIQEKEILEGYTSNQTAQGSNWGHGSISEPVQISDFVQTGSNSPVSVFKPIVSVLPNTSEERTLSPPQCRLEYVMILFCDLTRYTLRDVLVQYIKIFYFGFCLHNL